MSPGDAPFRVGRRFWLPQASSERALRYRDRFLPDALGGGILSVVRSGVYRARKVSGQALRLRLACSRLQIKVQFKSMMLLRR